MAVGGLFKRTCESWCSSSGNGIGVAVLLLAFGTSGCFFGKFYAGRYTLESPAPTGGGDGGAGPATPAFTFNSLVPSTLHLLTRSLTVSFDPADSPSATGICTQEGTSCTSCTSFTAGNTTSITVSPGSGAKQVSTWVKDADGNTSACTTSTYLVTDLDSAPDPLVAGAGRFSDRIKRDGSGVCDPEVDVIGSQCRPGVLARKLITAYGSCTGLSLTDGLGVYEWKCGVESDRAVFTGIMDITQHPLQELIDGGGATPEFKTNTLNLTVNSVQTVGAATTWYDDAIQEVPDSSAAIQTLSQPNTVYVYKTMNLTHKGYIIDANGVSLVGMGVAMVLDSGLADNCNSTSLASPSGVCMIATDPEASVSNLLLADLTLNAVDQGDVGVGLYQTTGAFLADLAFQANATSIDTYLDNASLISDVRILNETSSSAQIGIFADSSEGMSLSSVNIQKTPLGVYLNGGHNHEINGLKVAVASTAGLRVDSANPDVVTASLPFPHPYGKSVFKNLQISNAATGIYSTNSKKLYFTEFLISDAVHGVDIYGGITHTYMQGTIARTSNAGVKVLGDGSHSTQDLSFNNLAVISGAKAFDLNGQNASGSKIRLSNIATGSVAVDYAIGLNDTVYARENILTDSTRTFSVNPANTTSDFAAGTCADGACILSQHELGGTVTNHLAGGASLSASFLGKPGITDSSNPSASGAGSNTVNFNSISNWYSFLTPWRVWAQEPSVPGYFAAAPTDVNCSSGADTCVILDYSLGDPMAVLSPGPLRRSTHTGDGAKNSTTGVGRDFAHTVAQGGESSVACPSEIRAGGATSHVMGLEDLLTGGGPSLVLRLAVEVGLDSIGNDDGWCDAGEECLYTPNFGFFQGEYSRGVGYCDQSGDAVLDQANDTYKVLTFGSDGFDY